MNIIINSTATLILAILAGSVFIAAVVIWIWDAVNILIRGE